MSPRPRTFDQREADALGALVDGLTHLPCTCGRKDCAQQPGDGAGWVARKPLVHVIVLSPTLSGADEEPGYLDEYGLIDAEHARDRATNGNRQPVRVPDTATDATGPAEEVPLPTSAYSYRPSAILDTWIRILGGMCQWLHCDAPVWNTDLDHDTPFNHGDPTAGGRTTAAGMKPYCRHRHRHHHHHHKHCGAWAERHAERRQRQAEIDLAKVRPRGHASTVDNHRPKTTAPSDVAHRYCCRTCASSTISFRPTTSPTTTSSWCRGTPT